MRRFLLVGALTALVYVPDARASCVRVTPEQQSDLASLVFEGEFLPGPAYQGKLLSPARFRVTRYLKGQGGEVRLASTALIDRGGYLSVGIEPGAGERWRIFGMTRGDLVLTSICSGSSPLGSPSTTPFVRAEGSHAGRYIAAGAIAVLVALVGFVLLRRHRVGLRA